MNIQPPNDSYFLNAQQVISPTPTPTSSTNLLFQPQDAQFLQFQPPTTSTAATIQQYVAFDQQQQAYPSIDFYYEQPQNNIPDYSTPTTVASTAASATTTNTSTAGSTTTNSRPTENNSVDEDYVFNLANELQHTKQLLRQYQLRTEQLMNLVEKQTNKINELREQLNAEKNKKSL